MACGMCATGGGCACGGHQGGCHKSCGMLVLRLAIGVIFVLHGYDKLFGTPGMDGFIPMVAGLGFPLPTFFGYAAALSEFVGGLALLLGVGTKLFSALIGIVMLVALIVVKKFTFPRADVDLALFAMALTLFLVGPGKYTIMRFLRPTSQEKK